MKYIEEELLEAVDILVEEYGFNEDYAIELVNETYEMELYNEGLGKSAKNFAQAAQGYGMVNSKKWQAKQKENGWTDDDINYTKQDQKEYLKRQGKHLAHDVKPAAQVAVGSALVATSGVLAHKAYKKHKEQEMLKRRRFLGRRLANRRRR